MPDNSTRIAAIEAILAEGATQVTTPDGTSVTYDFDQLRRELNRLRQSDTTLAGTRPTLARINLSTAF